MLTFIYGGSGSGKSEIAENIAVRLGRERIYIAAMQPYGEEDTEKINRHRRQRSGKNFITEELYRDVERADVTENSVVLLECISSLAANEFFGGEGEAAAEKIKKSLAVLNGKCRELIVVSSNIFDDGIDYGEETVKYMKCMGEINKWLGKNADRIIEVVCGIEIIIKGTSVK